MACFAQNTRAESGGSWFPGSQNRGPGAPSVSWWIRHFKDLGHPPFSWAHWRNWLFAVRNEITSAARPQLWMGWR